MVSVVTSVGTSLNFGSVVKRSNYGPDAGAVHLQEDRPPLPRDNFPSNYKSCHLHSLVFTLLGDRFFFSLTVTKSRWGSLWLV